MVPAPLVIAQAGPAHLSDTARWSQVGLLSIDLLGTIAAIVTMLIALVLFKPKLREWRWAFVARVFAWRWIYLKENRLNLENVRVRDRILDRLLFRFSHWIAPRRWRMTPEDEEAWGASLNAGVEEYWLFGNERGVGPRAVRWGPPESGLTSTESVEAPGGGEPYARL